jgi:hypothetical protein
MEFCLLGPLAVRRGEAVVPVQAGRHGAVLAALLLNANQVVPVEELAETLPGTAPRWGSLGRPPGPPLKVPASLSLAVQPAVAGTVIRLHARGRIYQTINARATWTTVIRGSPPTPSA